MSTSTAYHPETRAGRDGFARLLHAEWTKFRTVRGWPIGMAVAALVIVGIALLDHSSCGGVVTPNGPSGKGAGCSLPTGPGGQAVTDSFYFVHQPLATGGSITVRMTSLSSPARQRQAGLQPWTKAGIIIKANTQPGSGYAAVLVTGRHGVRMQYNYTGDIAGPTGGVSAASPRWLRLTRSGDTLTGYASTDGTHWNRVGTAHLPGLPATVQAGMFAASPGTTQTGSQSLTSGSAGSTFTLASAVFDNVSLNTGPAGQGPGGAWAGDGIGDTGGSGPIPGSGFQQTGGTITVTGSGDIAPEVSAGPADEAGGTPIEKTLLGVFAALIAVIVIAAMYMTAEYRRGLIRITLTASPRRGRVLAAKAIVISSVTFAAALPGAAAAVPLGEALLRSNGNFVQPVSTLTEVRVVAGTAALLAVVAVLALALGALLRSSAVAITAAITAIVLPYLFTVTLPVLNGSTADWLLRLTPAAAFAIQQSSPVYPQVAGDYTPRFGYYPLAPWAGFAVLCGYTVLALALAAVLLRRRDV
jgi:ABC-type transport system involved in multi-copper enzyme maturation permease subunit